jgi:hypothetical protein
LEAPEGETMEIAGWIVWGLACLILVTQLPLSFHRDGGVARLATRYSLFIVAGLIATVFLDISKLHLIWWLPFTYFLNFALFNWSVKRKVSKSMEELLNQYPKPEGMPILRRATDSELSLYANAPEIGRQIKWIDAIGQVFRILDFDRTETTIGQGNTVHAKSRFKPYGYLIVESPNFSQPVRLPIVHRDDFLLAASVFDEPHLAELVTEEELLVTYVPEKHDSTGRALANSHVLHYVLVPRGTLEDYYDSEGDEFKSTISNEQLFGGFVYKGEIKVQVNPSPEV